MKLSEINIVSECCQQPIVTGSKPEYPLGGHTWGINYKVDICEGCGQEASELQVCGSCGDVECLGGCEV